MAGLGTDAADSYQNGIQLTGNSGTGTGVMTALDIETAWDRDIDFQNDEYITNATNGMLDLVGSSSTLTIELANAGNVTFTTDSTDDLIFETNNGTNSGNGNKINPCLCFFRSSIHSAFLSWPRLENRTKQYSWMEDSCIRVCMAKMKNFS